MGQVTIDLYDFQQEALDKLADVEAVLIADEMGLGKTYEAIAIDLERRRADAMWTARKCTLVVAPLTVLSVWEEKYEELTDLKVVRINPKDREGSFRKFVAHGDVFLVHWDALRFLVRDKDFMNVYWFHAIADECHRAKNRKAQQTQALKKIPCKWKSALSGTPAVNRPDELWSILNWLYPKTYSAYWRFFERYTDYEIEYPGQYRKVVGTKNHLELLQKLDPFYVRRLKQDVLKDLPDKYYTTLWVDLSPAQRRQYDQMRKEMIAWVGQHEDQPLVAPVIIAQLIRLQQFAVASAVLEDGEVRLTDPSSKVDALLQIIEDNPDEKFVVFSQFKKLVNLVNARLAAKDVSYVSLTGDTNQRDRGDVVARFQDGPSRVFTGTIAAGGVGITLHAASVVVFLDRSWSPAENQQAEDRLHRIGQKSAVQVIDVMAKDTVDLGRRQTLDLKWSWIRKLLGDT